MGKTIKTLLALLLLPLMSACGDNGSFFTSSIGSTGAASLSLLVSSPQLGSGNQTGLEITAIVKDSGNAVKEGESVIFTASSGSLVVSQGTTDANGQAKATLTPGNDFSNRSITISATTGSLSQSTTVDITGTAITVSGETTIVLGDQTTLIATLVDSEGNPIPGVTMTIASSLSNTLSASSLTTDSKGQVTVQVTGDNAGNDSISFNGSGSSATHTLAISGDQFQITAPAANTDIALGTNQSITVNWMQNNIPQTGKTINFSATRGILSANSAVTNASGDATVQISSSNAGPSTITAFVSNGPSATKQINFVATTAAKINLQTDKASIGPNDGSQSTQQQARLTATVRDANNNLVKGKVVRFSIINDISGGSLTASTATTDSLGKASTTYISSAATTAKDGVQIRAEVTEGAATFTNDATLTVAQSSLFISLGTGIKINVPTSTTYALPYSVIITDASGNAITNADVSITVVPLSFRKGSWGWNGTIWSQSVAATCNNEDANFNGVLDTGEDINGNGRIEPGNVASAPLTVTTGSDGSIEFNITYAQQYAQWVKVRLTASRIVAGTESTASTDFYLPIDATALADQKVAPPGAVSPFGTGTSCNNIL